MSVNANPPTLKLRRIKLKILEGEEHPRDRNSVRASVSASEKVKPLYALTLSVSSESLEEEDYTLLHPPNTSAESSS